MLRVRIGFGLGLGWHVDANPNARTSDGMIQPSAIRENDGYDTISDEISRYDTICKCFAV